MILLFLIILNDTQNIPSFIPIILIFGLVGMLLLSLILFKKRPKIANYFLIGAVIYAIIGIGICSQSI